jgi:hypothetical protein
MKSKTIKVNGESIVINELPIGRYAELISSIEELFTQITSMELFSEGSDVSVDELTDGDIKSIGSLLSQAAPQVIKLTSDAIDREEEWLSNEVGAADFMEIVSAVLEVNQIKRIKNSLAPLFQSFKAKKTG